MPQHILQVEPSAALDEETNHILVACSGCLVQRRRVGMSSGRVVSVGIFARVQQRSNNLHMTELRRHRQSQVSLLWARSCEKMAEFSYATESSCNGQVEFRAVPDQRIG